jgi:hypothetical protein
MSCGWYGWLCCSWAVDEDRQCSSIAGIVVIYDEVLESSEQLQRLVHHSILYDALHLLIGLMPSLLFWLASSSTVADGKPIAACLKDAKEKEASR